MEKGIGFNKKKGDFIELTKKTKIIPINLSDQEQKMLKALEELPNKLILMVEDTIKGAEKILKRELNTSLIFTLSTHIYYSLKRKEEIDKVALPFDYSLNYLFPEEYEAAKWSVNYLREEHTMELPDSEIIFFTFHFVNALQSSIPTKSVMDIGNVLNDIVKELETSSSILNKLDKESIHFSRFLIHIRYFLMNQDDKKSNKNETFKQLLNNTALDFHEAYYIVEKIQIILESKYNIVCNYEETLYLLLHVQRLIEEANER